MTLRSKCDAAFIRKVMPIMTPTLVARLGNKWYAAYNKYKAASIMRNIVTSEDIFGMAGTYSRLQANSPREELLVIKRILRSGQHAYRKHRDFTARHVLDLFKQTAPSDIEMLHVKEAVFGVLDGARILAEDHPALSELFQNFQGTFQRVSPLHTR